MAFGSGGGGFSFGQNSNNQSTGFGGGSTFGSTNNNTTGFGSSAFGSSNNNTSTTSAFGGGFGVNSNTNGGGVFGNNNNNTSSGGLFGNKTTTGFGATSTGGSLFGGSQNNNASGGFGTASTGGAFGTTNNTTTNGFGGNTSGFGSGAFGSTSNNNTNAFGGSTNKPLFGSSGTGTTGGFGSTGAFGNNSTGALGAVPPCPGTGGTPFQPLTEKDGANGAQVSYQSITFMQPYQKYSFEELRMADYEGGRQFGNASGQAGAFGQSNFGSGFGSNSNTTTNAFGANNNTSTSLFGNNNTTTSTAFGSNTATAGGFGSNNASGGLFGSQNKPAGGLFGQQTTAAPGGSLFGTANNTTTTGGFGASNNNTGGSLFGNNNAAKPGGLFGNSGAASTGGGLFGNTSTNNASTPSGGLFGNTGNTNNTSTGLFGQNNNAANNTGGLFGASNNNAAQPSGGLFGNKPATTGFGAATTTTPAAGGLFSSNNNTNTGGGLFGQQSTTNNTGGGLFGATNNNNAQQSGGLFGNQQKPGGLFGNTANNNTGGGLFGNNSTANTNTGGGLFGNNNQQQNNTGGGLFGNSNNTGGGLFGNNNNQQKPGGLFGTSTTNNNQSGGLFGNSMNNNSLFGQSQNQQQQNPNQQEVKHASLLDPNPYGQSTIWTALPTPDANNSRPSFTPLAATQKLEELKSKPISALRFNHSRYMTPPRRGGYGLNYSTYGTPSSVNSTPGSAMSTSVFANRSYGGGSFGRSFNRSASVQNLRSQYADDNADIWKPNAFTPSNRNSGGSIKRLVIDKTIRHDLFNRAPPVPRLPAPQPGAVDQDSTPAGNEEAPLDHSKKSKRVSWDDAGNAGAAGQSSALVRTEADDDTNDTPPPRNGNANGNLSAVPEDREAHQLSGGGPPSREPRPGDYWMQPSRAQLAKMSQDELKAVRGFKVGRYGGGEVTFDMDVDLTKIDLSRLYGDLIVIEARTITVYPNKDEKPPVGSGLNVPSTLIIENAWPRVKGKAISETSGPVFNKHMKVLKTMDGTHFVDYDVKTGDWTFKVDHYTRYGLVDDDDPELDQSELSLPSQTIDKSADASVMEVDDPTSDSDFDDQDEDDTFHGKHIPGQFGKRSVIPADDEFDDNTSAEPDMMGDDSSENSVISDAEEMSEDEQSPQMPGSMPPPSQFILSPTKPVSKLLMPGTPGKPLLDLEGDWAEQLQRTISPRKQNRDVLREAQSKIALDKAFSPIKPKPAPQVNFKSSIDIMNSIYKPAGSRKSTKAAEPDFEFPYAKRPKTSHSENADLSEKDQCRHETFQPRFTADGKLLYRASKPGQDKASQETPVVADKDDVVVAARPTNRRPFDLTLALRSSKITIKKSIPYVEHQPMPFSQTASLNDNADVLQAHELAHVLFDDYEDEFTFGLPGPMQKKLMHRIRRDRLAQFLTKINTPKARSVKTASTLQQAFLLLIAHDVKGAIELLKKDKNTRLAMIVSQLDSADQKFFSDMRHQIDAWRAQKSLSEFDLDIRAIYELCAGSVSICQGREGRGVPVEDRAETFSISTRYDLDWLQVFALGFFYGAAERDNSEGIATIEDAVREYAGRCERGEEAMKPSDDNVMWSLLKLYASSRTGGFRVPTFPDVLEGLGTAEDHSNVFTFYNTITSNLPVQTNTDKADQLTEAFASELSTQGDIASAAYVLIHLSKPAQRSEQIRNLLDRFGAKLPGPDAATTPESIQLWQQLTMDLKLPHAWIYMSKARFAASQASGADNVSELRYLIAAEEWNAAHACLLQRVAPGYIIDEDYSGLKDLIKLFGDDVQNKVADWHTGGDVYAQFCELLTGFIAKTDAAAIGSLRKRLVSWGRERHAKLSELVGHEMEGYVAMKEMANKLAKMRDVADIGTLDEILDLPLTSDVRMDVDMFRTAVRDREEAA